MNRAQARKLLETLEGHHGLSRELLHNLELRAVVRAFSNGEQVEFNIHDGRGWIEGVHTLCFDSPDTDYRIKPKAREFYVAPFERSAVCEDGGCDGHGQYREVSNPTKWDGVLRVREVIGEDG